MGSSDLSKAAAECHFENLVKVSCCCKGSRLHILGYKNDDVSNYQFPCFFSSFPEILKKVLGNDAGKMD